VQQLGELVLAIGADALPVEVLAGALIAAVDANDASTKEGWRVKGVAFFQRTSRASGGAGQDVSGASPNAGDAASGTGEAGA
jgi:hypothetical protein